MSIDIRHETLSADTFKLSAGPCSFTYRRIKPGALLMTINGDDTGQFGTATIDEVTAEYERFGTVSLYVNALDANGPATAVMKTWTAYFAANRKKLKTVVVLVSPESKLLHLTVSIVQHLSETGGLIKVVGTLDGFHQIIKQDIRGFEP
jgi:hypothetical protein